MEVRRNIQAVGGWAGPVPGISILVAMRETRVTFASADERASGARVDVMIASVPAGLPGLTVMGRGGPSIELAALVATDLSDA